MDGSGWASMSDSNTLARPSMAEPSKPRPSSKAPSTSAGASATDFSGTDDVGKPQAYEAHITLFDSSQNELLLAVHGASFPGQRPCRGFGVRSRRQLSIHSTKHWRRNGCTPGSRNTAFTNVRLLMRRWLGRPVPHTLYSWPQATVPIPACPPKFLRLTEPDLPLQVPGLQRLLQRRSPPPGSAPITCNRPRPRVSALRC